MNDENELKFEEAEPEVDEEMAPPLFPTTTPPPPALRKPKAVSRDVEQLHTVSVKSMTDVEMRKYIEFLKNELNVISSSAIMYKDNCDSAYDKLRALDNQFNNYKSHAQQKLLYVQRAVSNLNDAIRLIGIQEEK